MSRRDENFMSGVAVALYGLAVLLALVGALFLPPQIISTVFSSKWTFYITVVAVFVAVPIMLRLAQRSRIREAVEELGGTMVHARRFPFWRQGYWPTSYFPGRTSLLGVVYKVEFIDSLGTTHHAICRSGYLRGVQWLGEFQT